jgi:hypothetical protein
MKTYEEAVKAVVDFWIDKSFKANFNQNNGDNSENGGMAWLLMNTVSIQARNSVDDGKIEKFRDELTKALMQLKGGNIYATTLDVDYHPNEMLYNACIASGVDPGCLPCKTFTRIDKDNKAVAKYQYGGALVELI